MSVYPHVVAACKAFAIKYGTPNTVFYPGCGFDWSPSVAFPKATVVYLDPEQGSLDQIKRQYPNAIIACAKAEDAAPGSQYDLVLDMRTHAPFESRIRDLRREGHALVEQRGVDRFFDSSRMEFEAVIVPSGGAMRVDDADLEQYRECEPDYLADPRQPKYAFANGRVRKVPFYVFKKTA